MEILAAIITASVGVYCISAAWGNWEWFYNNWRARGFVKFLGRTGARIYYAVLGILFLAIGLLVLFAKFFYH